MRRLRRRITLICAGCPAGQSRMTVFRRELPPSKDASPPGQGPSVARGRRGLSNRACITRGSPAASGWDSNGVSSDLPTTPPRRPGPSASGRPRESRPTRGPGPPQRRGAASRARSDAESRRWSRSWARHAWARIAGGRPWLRRVRAAPSRGGCRACPHASTRIRRAWRLPALVMLPRRSRSPDEASLGTRPRYAMSCRGCEKRWKSPLAVSRVIAARVSIPRKQRSQPTCSR